MLGSRRGRELEVWTGFEGPSSTGILPQPFKLKQFETHSQSSRPARGAVEFQLQVQPLAFYPSVSSSPRFPFPFAQTKPPSPLLFPIFLSKFPNYPPSTLAFQRVSFAYETLSKPNSRRIYDVSGRHDLAAAMNGGGSSNSYTGTSSGNAGMGMESGDETLNGVLYSVFCEFLRGILR